MDSCRVTQLLRSGPRILTCHVTSQAPTFRHCLLVLRISVLHHAKGRLGAALQHPGKVLCGRGKLWGAAVGRLGS